MKELMISMLLGAMLAWWFSAVDAVGPSPSDGQASQTYGAAGRN